LLNEEMNMKRATGSSPARQERGVALIVALFALLLLSAIAMGMMFMANTEISVNSNYKDGQSAYFASRAGLEEARIRIMNDATGGTPMGVAMPTVAPATMPSAGGGPAGPTWGLTYILNPLAGEPVQPWAAGKYMDTQFCKEQYGFPAGADPGVGQACTIAPAQADSKQVAASNLGANGLNYFKWVRISMKRNLGSAPYKTDAAISDSGRVCFDGVKEFASTVACEGIPMPMGAIIKNYTTVYTVTSLGVTPTGARRMTQMEVAISPPVFANAAVDSQDHVTLNGQLTVNGYDNCSCMPLMTCNSSGANPGTGTNQCKNADGTPTYVSRPGKTCDNTKWAIYSSSTVDNPNASETIVAGPNPAIAQNQAWPYDIPTMINEYRSSALDVRGAPYNYSCTNPTYDVNGNQLTSGSCGTKTAQTFGVPPNFPPTPPDAPLGPPDMASQVTYVPGDLKITASSRGNGVLIIDGDLDINGGLEFYGLILVRGVVKFTGGGSQATNIFGAVLAGQQSMVDNVLGGSAVINYDACSLIQTTNKQPPKVLTAREVMY
jgi:Tfp pilus assembly protein PilX